MNLELNNIYNLDALEGLKKLDDCSIDCIITSPPYYQLRDYGHEEQIGQEPTFYEYIDKLVVVFEECKRILKNTGTLWIVISDSFNGSKFNVTDRKSQIFNQEIKKRQIKTINRKSLLGIPSRLMIRLIDNGWILRNEIIWEKPNVMPSSVKDRFTINYEKVLFFTKDPTYYFKQLKEPMKTTDLKPPRGSKGVLGNLNNGRRTKQIALGKETYTNFNQRYVPPKGLMRNMRCVWEISSSNSTIEHFAMFPEELVERFIEAGCPKNGVVLDPFIGSGTTAIVSKKLNRDYIGFDINKSYCELAQERANNQPRLLTIFTI